MMRTENNSSTSRVAAAIFDLLNPIPFGFFVAAMIFDIIYAKGGDLLWVKSAAWLVSIGLVFAIIPRLINLWHVWFGPYRTLMPAKIDFWLNLLAVVTALINAFVHSRDAYGAIPEGVWLSVITVILLSIGRIAMATRDIRYVEVGHE